jgi:integrase
MTGLNPPDDLPTMAVILPEVTAQIAAVLHQMGYRDLAETLPSQRFYGRCPCKPGCTFALTAPQGSSSTGMSRRTLALPQRCTNALRDHRNAQEADRAEASTDWHENGLVFASKVGTELDSHNVRRAFRAVVKKAGLVPEEWTPRELRHSFVSILSDSGVSIQDIADLCGHAGTVVTEKVYRHQLRPILLGGAVAMDQIFAPAGGSDA